MQLDFTQQVALALLAADVDDHFPREVYEKLMGSKAPDFSDKLAFIKWCAEANGRLLQARAEAFVQGFNAAHGDAWKGLA